MRGNTLFGSLGFGAVCALGSIPWLMVTTPLFGRPWALALYCLAAAVLYLVIIAPSAARSLAMGGLAGVLALVVGLLAPWPPEAILGAVLIVAVVRSGFLYRSRPARALLLEGSLAIGGLVTAYALAGSTLLGTALAIWSFFLVQSLFFLTGGVRERDANELQIDPFEQARRKALALMEEV